MATNVASDILGSIEKAEVEAIPEFLTNLWQMVGSIEKAEVEAVPELLTNLRQMVNEPTFSDVAFLCKDGKKVQAARMLLTGRSAVFKSMLTSGMAESGLSEIELPEITSPVLLSVFEFLYTGSLSDYYPQNWTTACEIKVASRFFLLPKLEMTMTKFMLNLITGLAGDLPATASLLTEAVGFKALCYEPDVSLRVLVTTLSSNLSESIYTGRLSEDAFHYLLESTSGESEDCNELSFKEFDRFRQVIRWWVCQSEYGSGRAEELVNFVALDEGRAFTIHLENADSLISNSQDGEQSARLANEWHRLQLDKTSRNSVARLLSSIDFRRVHPILLAKVVEPLNLISPAEIVSAFRFHAVRIPATVPLKITKSRRYVWKNICGSHGEPCEPQNHRTLEGGRVVEKSRKRFGSALMMVEMSSSYALYQWRFIVEEMPSPYWQIGFAYFTDERALARALTEPSWANRMLSQSCLQGAKINYEEALARALPSRYDRMLSQSGLGGAKINWAGGAGPGGHAALKFLGLDVQCGSKVEFKLNTYKRNCSLIVDDHDFGIVWEDIPKAIYYPEVSLGYSKKGRVRIELVSGFNIL